MHYFMNTSVTTAPMVDETVCHTHFAYLSIIVRGTEEEAFAFWSKCDFPFNTFTF